MNRFKKLIRVVDYFFREKPASAMVVVAILSQVITHLSQYRISFSFHLGSEIYGPYSSIVLTYILFFLVGVTISFTLSQMLKIRSYRAIDIYDVNLNMNEGFTPSKMLKEIRTDFRFLGTGANKLTSDENFERISGLDQCRILLCDPTCDGLREIGTSSDSNYISTVERSIKKIKEIIDRGNNNIELRLYKAETAKEMPVFRLAFYNDNCIVSYNYFSTDKQDGSQLPQIHLKRDSDKEVHSGFYYSYSDYFKRLWDICADSSYKYGSKENN